MAARVIWGPLKMPGRDDAHGGHGPAEPAAQHDTELPQDIGAREIGILVPLALCVLILGVYPNVILNSIEKPAQAITQAIHQPTQPVVAEAR